MSYIALSSSDKPRNSLLLIVIGAHLGLAALLLTAKVVTPLLQEAPIMVDFIPLAAPKPEPLKVQPKIKQAAPSPAPRTPQPPLETTSSKEPAPNAIQAQPSESKPVAVQSNAAPQEAPLSQARFDADYLKNPPPPYPGLSRKLGESGKVILRVSVSATGLAESVEIRTSSGSERLDESARKTVLNWKFIPAKRGDTPTQSWVLVPIIFKLEQ